MVQHQSFRDAFVDGIRDDPGLGWCADVLMDSTVR